MIMSSRSFLRFELGLLQHILYTKPNAELITYLWFDANIYLEVAIVTWAQNGYKIREYLLTL